MKKLLSVVLVLFVWNSTIAQTNTVPDSYTNIRYDESNRLYYENEGQKFYADTAGSRYTIKQLLGNPQGTEDGLAFDFANLKGTFTYGLIPYGKAPHPLPVFRLTSPLVNGKVTANVKRDFRYPFDFVGWEENKGFTLGYRLTDEKGMIVFDGEVAVEGTGPFKVVPTIYEGPFVNNISATEAVIWYETSEPVISTLSINNKIMEDAAPVAHHEFKVSGLKPGTKYDYTVKVASLSQTYHITTAPKAGSRKPFVFAYTSDSRHATGSGERMIYGANAYIMKKMAALYDNVAMIVLNSDYWYAPTLSRNSYTIGGLHGYLMDNQMDWLRKIMQEFEQNPSIDRIIRYKAHTCFPKWRTQWRRHVVQQK